MTVGQEDPPQPFSAMAAAAQEAAGVFESNPVVPGVGNPGNSGTLREEYAKQIDLNHKAHREMRWVAFIGIGAFVALFLFILLFTLVALLDREMILRLVSPDAVLNWHVLVFFGLLVAVFAAIPLSLAMALVKMISERDSSPEDSGLKMPSTELGKVILDLMKSVIAAAKP